MGALSRAVLGAQREGEGLCRAHMSCEANPCQGLEQMRLPWLLQPGSTWPPAASRLCTGHQAPGTAPGSLNLLSALGEPTSPDPAGTSRSPGLRSPINADDPDGNKEAAMGTFHPGFAGKVAPRSFPPLPVCPFQGLAALAGTSCTAQTPGPRQSHGAALAKISWRITHRSGSGSLPKSSSPAHVAAKGVLPGNAGGTLHEPPLMETAPWKDPGSPPAWHWAWFDHEGAGWVLRLLSPEPRALLVRSCQRESAAPT